MAYTPPRLEIQQDFEAVPVFTDAPLAALIVGPQYNLVRYASEKASALVGNYVSDADTTYNYPNRPTNTVVDTGYTQVYFDSAALQYFPNSALGTASAALARVGTYTNRFRSTDLVFKTGNGTARSDVFSGRDVQVGDIAIITDNDSLVTTTKVTNLVADVNAASVSSVSQGAGNAPTQSTSVAIVPADTYANISTAVQTSTYVGYPALGVVSDTYTVVVTTGGNLSAVRFSVTSDNSVFTAKTNVALTTVSADADILIVDNAAGNDVSVDFTGSTAFVVGDTFEVNTVAQINRRTPTLTGTYTGAKDLVYTGTIVRGGPAYNGTNASTCAQIYFTSSGTDSAGPFNLAIDTDINAGNYGVKFQMPDPVSTTSFILNDAYVFTATAATAGDYKTLVFKDSIPVGSGSPTYSVVLAKAKNDFIVPQLRSGGTANWTSGADSITITSDIYDTDTLLVGTDATLAQLPVISAKVYVQHRDLLRTKTGSLNILSDITLVESTLGTKSPDNPLAQGVYNALLSSGTVGVYYIGINTDDVAGYTTALGIAAKSNKVYGVVPLTKDTAVKDLVEAHVNGMSTSVNAKWRVAWLTGDVVTTEALYDLNGEDDYTATVSDDPQADNTQYTLFTVAGAQFITDGVRVGDLIRYNYTTDITGAINYDTFEVAEVRSETSLVSATALSAASSAKKITVWRVYSKQEQAENFAARTGNNRRVRVVFPGTLTLGDTTYESYFAAAALAGLRSSVAPHESLTNIEVPGFDGVAETLGFTDDELNTIADQGVWILTQDVLGGAVYTRHQLTTDRSSTKTQEDQFTSNTDSISYGLQAKLDPFIGKYNITPETKIVIYDTIASELRYRQTNTFTSRGGNQLLGFEITKFEQNSTFRDRLDIGIRVDEPYPFNNGEITITV